MITASFPEYRNDRIHAEEAHLMQCMQDVVRGIRNSRAELGIPADKKLRIVIRPDKNGCLASFMAGHVDLLKNFTNAGSVEIDAEKAISVEGAFPVAGQGFETYVFVRDAIDVDKEIAKLEEEISKAKALLEGSEKKLSNEKFVSFAKPEAIEKERAKKREFEEKIEKTQKHIEVLRSF